MCMQPWADDWGLLRLNLEWLPDCLYQVDQTLAGWCWEGTPVL
jgi:hypothetical protein